MWTPGGHRQALLDRGFVAGTGDARIRRRDLLRPRAALVTAKSKDRRRIPLSDAFVISTEPRAPTGEVRCIHMGMGDLGVPSDGSQSAQDVTYRWLKRHVGALPRHEGIFLTESEVSQATGRSRTPVREAMLRLEAEGFLQIVPKKGAFVPPISDAEVSAVMEARALVEDWCAQMAATTTYPLAAELDDLVRQQTGLLDDPVEFIECDRAFHRAIIRSAGNPVLSEFYESLRDRQVRMGLHAIAAAQDRAQTVLDEHARIVEAIRAGDSANAAETVSAHLRSTLEAMQLPVVSNWPGGRPRFPTGE